MAWRSTKRGISMNSNVLERITPDDDNRSIHEQQ